jgi:DNA-binding NarL/FixJ family response regulator
MADANGVRPLTANDQPGAELYRELLERERRLHEAVRRLVGEDQPPPGNGGANARPPAVSLSPRELDIIRLVAKGATNQEIGRELRLSPGTVRNYNGRIFRKLGVEGRTEAAVRALELGIVPAASRPE